MCGHMQMGGELDGAQGKRGSLSGFGSGQAMPETHIPASRTEVSLQELALPHLFLGDNV